MPVYVKDGDVWKQATVYVRDGGAWKQATLSARDGGAWKIASVFVGQISPSAQNPQTSNSSHTFGPSSLSVTGAAPTSITWSFEGSYGGVWSVVSGQGTLEATARVTNVAAGEVAAAIFRCTVVVAGTTYTRDCYLEFTRSGGGQ